jgi:PAS domain S-box-containing protein
VRVRVRDVGQTLPAVRGQERDHHPSAEARFRAVVDSVADGIVSISGGGRIISLNPAAQLIYGYRPAEVVGSSFTILLAEQWRFDYEKALKRFLRWGRSELVGTTQEIEGERRNGETFPAELVLSPWTVDGETFFTAVLRDITERKALARLEEANYDLERFAYVASHDLSEPLRTVTSYVQLLATRYEGCLGKDADEFIDFALQGTRRMQALIDGLLEYSRAGWSEQETGPADSGEIVHGVLAQLRSAIDETGVVVKIGQLPVLWADTRQLGQVFQNLISNALTYRSEEPRIDIGAERIIGGWRFWVSDNGIGIAERDAERIFEMLERLHTPQEYPGSGLGLAICKRIVERHGGRIWTEPNAESGTSFHFTIPDPGGGRRNGSIES